MEFRVNGIPFFAKGACWIPEDNFLDRVTPEIYKQRLGDAVAANMNMIRVWTKSWKSGFPKTSSMSSWERPAT
jgi:beta-galactosidase/beta-glucuronidase